MSCHGLITVSEGPRAQGPGVHVGPEVRTMGGACTSAQLRNITLCSQLNEVHRSLVALLPRLPPQSAANLRHCS
jgi:hypothetical protein